MLIPLRRGLTQAFAHALHILCRRLGRLTRCRSLLHCRQQLHFGLCELGRSRSCIQLCCMLLLRLLADQRSRGLLRRKELLLQAGGPLLCVCRGCCCSRCLLLGCVEVRLQLPHLLLVLLDSSGCRFAHRRRLLGRRQQLRLRLCQLCGGAGAIPSSGLLVVRGLRLELLRLELLCSDHPLRSSRLLQALNISRRCCRIVLGRLHLRLQLAPQLLVLQGSGGCCLTRCGGVCLRCRQLLLHLVGVLLLLGRNCKLHAQLGHSSAQALGFGAGCSKRFLRSSRPLLRIICAATRHRDSIAAATLLGGSSLLGGGQLLLQLGNLLAVRGGLILQLLLQHRHLRITLWRRCLAKLLLQLLHTLTLRRRRLLHLRQLLPQRRRLLLSGGRGGRGALLLLLHLLPQGGLLSEGCIQLLLQPLLSTRRSCCLLLLLRLQVLLKGGHLGASCLELLLRIASGGLMLLQALPQGYRVRLRRRQLLLQQLCCLCLARAGTHLLQLLTQCRGLLLRRCELRLRLGGRLLRLVLRVSSHTQHHCFAH